MHSRAQKHTHRNIHTYICTQVEAGEREEGGTAKHQISGERSKLKDQNVFRRRGRAEQREAAEKGAVEMEIESFNFKLM